VSQILPEKNLEEFITETLHSYIKERKPELPIEAVAEE